MVDKNKKAHMKIGFGMIIGIFVVIGGIVGFDQYVDYKVMTGIKRPEVLDKLRQQVRPMVIFDDNGSILSDMGARQYVEDEIKIKKTRDKKFIKELRITLKNPLSIPILTCLDNSVDYLVNPKRGKKLEIIYELIVNSYSEPRSKVSLFNIEIITGEALQYQITELKDKRTIYFPGKIVVDSMDARYKPGKVRFRAPMKEKPTYIPQEGDTYFNLNNKHWVTFSNGKWRSLLMSGDDLIEK